MAGGRRGALPALITSARVGKSLDADARNRRYLISMTVRVVCFIIGALAPAPYNVILMVAAAVIPGIAVILANASDLGVPEVVPDGPTDAPALPAGLVVSGDVDEDGSR